MLKLIKNIRNYSSCKQFKEIKIPVPWGHISGKWWAPFHNRPILAFHGVQDNCASFDRLIPLINNEIGFLTIDLPGHGYSSRLPPGMFYNNLNYLLLIKTISKFFDWPKTSLMGHSLGGISCYTYAMLFPEMVDLLICIDGFKPLIKKNNVKRMREGIEEFLKYDLQLDAPPKNYELEDLKQEVVALTQNSIDYKFAEVILRRNIARSKVDPGKYYVSLDPRVRTRLLWGWSQTELLEFANLVTCPMLLFKCKQGSYYEDKSNQSEVIEVLRKSCKDFQFYLVDGTHHGVLNQPENMSDYISEFVRKWSLGGERGVGMQGCSQILVEE